MGDSEQSSKSVAVGSSADVNGDGRGDVADGGHDGAPTPGKKFNRSKRFWAIIATLSVCSILSALENTVVTTALPVIVTQLDLGPSYIWVTNVFFLTGCVYRTWTFFRTN